MSPRETAAPAPTSAELIARARNFIPKLIECSAETDRERRVPHRVVDEMREAGLFRALQPKRWGGYETDVGTYYEIEMALDTRSVGEAAARQALSIPPPQS